jgi:uncharacterized membrane protein YdfJ with MMPL/SSD domain
LKSLSEIPLPVAKTWKAGSASSRFTTATILSASPASTLCDDDLDRIRRRTREAADERLEALLGREAVVKRLDADPAFQVFATGNGISDNDFNTLSQEDLRKGELGFGAPGALIVLVLVFGSVVAGLVPLLIAILSIAVALGLVAVYASFSELSVFVVNMLTGMGLALGIDYSLFVISRYREERSIGREPQAAIEAAGATASRAVLFSGTAFVIAMLGMLIVPNTVMRSLAAGAILVGVTSLFAALTLLPALLGLLGDRVNSLRIPLVGGAAEGRFWSAVVRRVLSRPALSLVLACGLLIAAAIPVFSLRIGTNGVSTLPDRFISKQGYLALQKSFPGATADPVRIVVADHASDPQVRSALNRLQNKLAGDPDFGDGRVRFAPGGQVAALDVPILSLIHSDAADD